MSIRVVTPNDYSPTYYIEVDEAGRFVRLVRVHSVHPEWEEIGQGQDIPIDEHLIAYAKGLVS